MQKFLKLKHSFKNTLVILCAILLLNIKINDSFASFAYQYLENANYYLLMDADTSEILKSRNIDEKISPSSMTKLMTAYVVFDQVKKGNVRLQNRCLIGKDAWRKSGSSMFLNYGDVVSVDDLLKGLLAVSANDAAIALAQTTADSYEHFINLMNLKAKELKMNNSHFMNPHGLHQDGHYMTLKDLATLIIRLYNDFPEYSQYMSIPEFTYRNITQKNRNPLIKNHYEGIIGGKTGHTNQGGYGLVVMVKRDNRKLVAVVNKAPNPKVRENIITELLDYGFNNFKKIYIYEKGDEVAKINVWLGNKKQINGVINKSVNFNVRREVNLNDIKVEVKYKSPLNAPIKKNEVIGAIQIKIEGDQAKNFDIFAKENIDKVGFIRKIKRILEYKINNQINRFLK
ncbi:MAG: D-alanyl-D-alanine carboxypeptidase family protein [Alphaproteobacteria bacterium]